MSEWKYMGDVNIECGGYYWRDVGEDDYVEAVQVTPCSDAGGPDNLFYVEKGSIYLGNADLANVLDTIGMTPAEATREDIVYAFNAYRGMERACWGGETVIQVGPTEEPYRWDGWSPEPDYKLRRNVNLRRHIENNFLS